MKSTSMSNSNSAPGKMNMKIGELAQRTGLASSRIRFYERIGLLRMVEREANGYRSYPADAVVVLQLITAGQRAGFSLDELRALLPGDLAQWQHDTLMEALQRKVQDIEALQAQLAQSKSQLVDLIAQIEAKPDDMACDANARRVLSQVRLDGPGDASASSPATKARTGTGRRGGALARAGRRR